MPSILTRKQAFVIVIVIGVVVVLLIVIVIESVQYRIVYDYDHEGRK
jgi:hypothetical protein